MIDYFSLLSLFFTLSFFELTTRHTRRSKSKSQNRTKNKIKNQQSKNKRLNSILSSSIYNCTVHRERGIRGSLILQLFFNDEENLEMMIKVILRLVSFRRVKERERGPTKWLWRIRRWEVPPFLFLFLFLLLQFHTELIIRLAMPI